MKVIAPPAAGTYSEYQKRYVDLLEGKNPLAVLEAQVLDFKVLLSEIPFEKEGYAYADGKWTIASHTSEARPISERVDGKVQPLVEDEAEGALAEAADA